MASLIPAGASSVDVSVAELRDRLADVLNTIAYSGSASPPPVVFVTRHGRRIAAVVPVAVAEDLEQTPVTGEGDSTTSASA